MLRNEDMKSNDRGFAINGNSFLWLIALEHVLHTLCKAGAYMVDDPEDNRTADIRAASPQVLNIDRSYIEEHLASCRKFIVEWTTKNIGPSYQTVPTQVSRIDLAVRSKWTDMYRTNLPAGITFTNCMRKTEATAESLDSRSDSGHVVGSCARPKRARTTRESGPRNCRKEESQGRPRQ